MNPLVSALTSFSNTPVSVVQELENAVVTQFLGKGESLLEIGQVARKMYFIHTGVARVYYLKEGRDVTDYFAIDNQFIGAVESLFTQKPSQKAMETLTETELSYILYADFESLCSKHHSIEAIGRKTATFAFLEGQQRIESIRFMSAGDRYHELERKYPGLTNRIPLKYIASYLGTSQVSLSRIRAGIQ